MLRKAGQVWLPTATNSGEGCATKPETYPPKPKGGMSHGPSLLGQKYV